MFGKKATQDTISIPYEGVQYVCLVKRTRRKTVSLSVKRDGQVVVHSTPFASMAYLTQLVKNNIVWIANKVHYMNMKKQTAMVSYAYGSTIPFVGRDITLYTGVDLNRDYMLDEDILYVRGVDPLDVRLSVKSFYRQQAKDIFHKRTMYWIGQIHFADADTKIIIKEMATRWGSMSSTGRMNLNIALIRTPLACIDYVIVHELCHQKHPHHQPPFWLEVRNIMPDYKVYEKQLKLYSTDTI